MFVDACLQGAAAMFAANLELPDSPHRPYFDALPSQDEVMCPLIYLPAEYLHLLQSPKAVRCVRGFVCMQLEARGFCTYARY
jgi:hypothetical protein